MLSFSHYLEQAEKQHPDFKLRLKHMSKPLPSAKLAKISDDRYLSALSQCVFQSGFNWTVVANKWPRFEEVFCNFRPDVLVMWPQEQYEKFMQDTSIIRHMAKINSVYENALFFTDLQREHGSAAEWFASWKPEDYADNLKVFRKRGNRVGGRTGQIFLRRMGVDSPIFSDDTILALTSMGIIDGVPSSKASWKAFMEAMLRWREETGYSLTELSQILSWSVGPRR
jgi:3-methyladenine DNA glycosylase Tag